MMGQDRREFYRLKMYGEAVDVVIGGGIEIRGFLQDLSGSGLSFESEHDVVFHTADVRFGIEEEAFTRTVELVRTSDGGYGRKVYAVQFTRLTQKEQKAYYHALMKLDAKKRLNRKNLE